MNCPDILKCYEAVLELLFKSDSIMQNSVVWQIKLCRNEDTIKQNNRLDAINKWFNLTNWFKKQLPVSKESHRYFLYKYIT